MKIERIIKLTGALMLMLVTVVSLVPIAWAAPPCGPGTFGRRFVLFDRGTTVCDNLSGVHWERTPVSAQRTFDAAHPELNVALPALTSAPLSPTIGHH